MTAALRDLTAGLRWFFLAVGVLTAILTAVIPFGWVWGYVGYLALSAGLLAVAAYGFRTHRKTTA